MSSAPGSVPAGSGRPDPLFRSPFAVTRTFSLDRRATYLQAVDFDVFFSFLRRAFITRTLPTVTVADATPILTVKNRVVATAHCAL